jgi:hypothetical protein
MTTQPWYAPSEAVRPHVGKILFAAFFAGVAFGAVSDLVTSDFIEACGCLLVLLGIWLSGAIFGSRKQGLASASSERHAMVRGGAVAQVGCVLLVVIGVTLAWGSPPGTGIGQSQTQLRMVRP